MTQSNEYLSKEGYAFMGAVFEVYKELGCGLCEEIYQESLELELGWRNITFSPQSQLDVFYKGHRLNKRYIPDLLVSNEIVVELKAVKAITSEHEQQLLNYMHITPKAVGYLVNFGTPKSVEWKRYILSQYIPEQ
ncbi:MAG: GxxExxY protein [Coraliomargarita sp.]